MNKDMKIVLIALVVVMIGAISFTYLDTTGKAVSKSITSISVNPRTVKAGEFIYITVDPGRQGVYQELEIYRGENNLRFGGQTPSLCKTGKCFERDTIKYRISDGWDDNENWDSSENSKNYYVKVYDIYSSKWISTYFSVERAYETKGPSRHP